MRMMLALKNGKYAAFFEVGEEEKAIELRKTDRRMKYARVIEAIQMLPSKVEMGKVYERT